MNRALLIVDIQNDYFPGATFLLPDTEGVKIHPSVAPLATETIITKHFPNGFRDTKLLEALRAAKIERLDAHVHRCDDAGGGGPGLPVHARTVVAA